MSNREVELRTCPECESTYKLAYNHDETSGYSKFCPFCAADVNEDPVEEEEQDE